MKIPKTIEELADAILEISQGCPDAIILLTALIGIVPRFPAAAPSVMLAFEAITSLNIKGPLLVKVFEACNKDIQKFMGVVVIWKTMGKTLQAIEQDINTGCVESSILKTLLANDSVKVVAIDRDGNHKIVQPQELLEHFDEMEIHSAQVKVERPPEDSEEHFKQFGWSRRPAG